MYTNEERAIKLVVKAFENKKRIKEDINLSVHSINVGYMLKDIGCNENIIISGFLHDIIEDTNYDYNYLKENFNKEIADNVLIVSEDMSITDWHKRKEVFINNLYNQNENIILIELADKLHNLIFDYDLWLVDGKDALATLNTSYEDNKWYYLEMRKLFNSKLDSNKLLDRYNEMCDLYFK